LLDLTEQNLAELTAARHRVSSGSYGDCDVCGQPIAVERLLVRPESRSCVACAAKRATERRGSRGR
jgi:RNA polymerase-binding transcription factor DksA